MARLTFKEAYCSIKELEEAKGATHSELSAKPVGTFKSGRDRYQLKLFRGSVPLGTFDAMKLQSKFTDGDRWMVSKFASSWDTPERKTTLDDVFET